MPYPAVAQNPAAVPGPIGATPPATGDKVTAAEIETRRKQAEESPDLAEDVKKKIADLYRQAAENLANSQQQEAQATSYKAAADNVQARLTQLKSELDALQNMKIRPPGDLPLAELEQLLSAKDVQLKELKAAQAKLDAEPTTRSTRRKELRGLLLSAAQRQDDLKKQLEAAPPADESPHLTLARRTEALTRRMLVDKQTPTLLNELAKYDAEEASDLLRVQRDLLARQVVLVQKEFDLLNEAANRRRESEAREAVRQAQEEAIYAQPVLKPLAEENQKLAEEAQSLTTLISETERQLKSAKERLEGVERQKAQAQKKVDNVGLTGAIGLMLRKQRGELPDVRKRSLNVSNRRQTIDAVQLSLFEYDDERTSISNTEPIVKQLVLSAGADLDAAQREFLQSGAQHVLDRKKEYLDTLIRSYNSYFDALVELDTTERQLISVTQKYQHYIDERVLWIRSARPLYSDFRLDDSDYQLISPAAWEELGGKLWTDARENFAAYVLAGIGMTVLLWLGIRCRRDIAAQGEIAERGNCCQFLPTFRTALATLVLVLPWPSLMLFLAWRISPLAARDGLACGVVHGLFGLAVTYFLLQLTKQLCRPGGLGESHFQWPESATRLMRRSLRMLMIFGLPLVVTVATLKGIDPEHGRDVLERSGLLLIAALLAVFASRAFSPITGVFKEYLAYNPGGWLSRMKHVWYWALVSVPVFLAGLSLFGYHYTARQLASRMYITATLVLLVIVARSMLLRLVLIARRKLTMAEARRRREETTAGTASANNQAAMGVGQLVAPSAPQVDLKTHSADSAARRHFAGGRHAGGDVVHLERRRAGLGFLDRFSLWTTTVTVAEQAVDAAGEATVASTEKIMTVTLADVGLAAIIAIVTIVAGRNVPGLLEMAVLRRLPLENSIRYAITTMASYAIILVGVIVGCQTIGLRWSQIQWLATALTFGLAFGLQEMFANFIAGLIILFERPVRVGDIVTVDDTSGVVSKIRIRATTITDWDRKEYIVPNKEFITGKVLNWTLSDQVNRVVITVGVAYGSNTKLAHELLLKVANDHPLTLEQPPTMASFDGFGDSCLNFTLRTFLPSMENRLLVIHELHTAIDEAFREADIEISFPQRDLHIRTLPKEIAALAKIESDAEEQQRGAA